MIGKHVKSYKKAIEQLYDDTCSIYQDTLEKDPITQITSSKNNVLVYENQKCRISYKTINSSSQTDSFNTISQEIKLFISEEIKILEGSKIVVTRNGIETEYKASGMPALYPTHQEVILIAVGKA